MLDLSAHIPGRLVAWQDRGSADWIAHATELAILLEPVSPAAELEMLYRPDDGSVSVEGLLYADWWDSTIAHAVARELALGWDVAAPDLNLTVVAQTVAAILSGDPELPYYEVPDEAVADALAAIQRRI